MPTSRAIALFAVATLGACEAGPDVGRRAAEAVRLPDGMTVAGARGWCVDPGMTRTGGSDAVVVLGSCAALAGDAMAPRPPVPGVVTVSVDMGGEAPPPADLLEGFFRTDAGRATLARDGRAETVTVLETRRSGDRLFLHARNRETALLPGETPEYWRAFAPVDGRLVTVSLMLPENRPVSRADGLAALEAQVDRLVQVNG